MEKTRALKINCPYCKCSAKDFTEFSLIFFSLFKNAKNEEKYIHTQRDRENKEKRNN